MQVNSFIHENNSKTKEPPQIEIIKVRPIVSVKLLCYIAERKIPVHLIDRYLKEVNYSNNGAKYYALGFENDKGGYELRSAYFKGSSSPKYNTHFKNNSDTLCVFEGFMDFLSFLTILEESNKPICYDFLILNSLSFVTVSIQQMLHYPGVHLYLDNNSPGDRDTQLIKSQLKQAEDKRSLYKNHEDLNLYLCFHGSVFKN